MDFETRSDVDITKCGSYAYIHSPNFKPLLLSYSIDGGAVQTVDFTNQTLKAPGVFLNIWRQDYWREILWNPEYLKTAYNVAFEREVWSVILGERSPIDQWQDTQVLAAYAGLPRRLADVGPALGLPEDKQKLKTGNDLIRFFCIPYKGAFRDPAKYPEKWQQFIEYNRQDVVTEQTIRDILIQSFGFPDREQKLWQLDQEINDRGIQIDTKLVGHAIDFANSERERLMQEAKDISHLDNPNSVAQLKTFLELDEDQTLRKADVANLLKTVEDKDQKRILEIRSELGMSSVKKYEAMARSACPDGRVHGSLLFYGANRTGRWAGRLLQPQNFTKHHIPEEELDYARELVKEGDIDSLKLLFGSVNDMLSQMTRTAMVPKEGCAFAVADFSAIEARVIAWLARESWRMKAFAAGKDIYCESASQMFHVPVEKHGVNADLRQKGKIAELALGYGGSVGAMLNMGADKMGLSEEELQEIVYKWRNSSPKIVNLWYNIGETCLATVKGRQNYECINGIVISRVTAAGIPVLRLLLPSGRYLHYLDPEIGVNRFGGESLTYMGYDAGKWSRVETFGGKIVENIVQAIARDCLAEAMMRVSEKNYGICFHVHDEAIVEVETDRAEQCLKDMLECMAEPIVWAPGLLLKGDGYLCRYYIKR